MAVICIWFFVFLFPARVFAGTPNASLPVELGLAIIVLYQHCPAGDTFFHVLAV
jgi:hypothetical protein